MSGITDRLQLANWVLAAVDGKWLDLRRASRGETRQSLFPVGEPAYSMIRERPLSTYCGH